MRPNTHGCYASRSGAAAVLLALTIAACGGGHAPVVGTSPAESAALPLEAGDALRITFSREPELNGDFIVDETGSVNLPLLGAVPTTSRPAAELKTDLETRYGERTRNQSVQVIYLRRVRVLGEVRSPGLFHVDPTLAFADVLALAGGATDVGDLEDVRVVRDGQTVEDGLDVTTIAGTRLRSGDQLYVPKTSWFSRNAAVLIGATISAVGVIVAIGN